MINTELLNKLSNAQEVQPILETMPQQVKPVVTQSDADNGFLVRYFVRQTNDKTFIVEVDKNQYTIFKNNPRFITVEIKWKLVGKQGTIKFKNGTNLYGTEDVNRIAVAEADLTFGGLRNYITDYKEFWLRE